MPSSENSENSESSEIAKIAKVAKMRRRQNSGVHRALAVEHMYCARNSNFVSEFNIAVMALVYAVSSRKLVVNIVGRVGPGGSYSTLKNWLKANSGEPISAPKGVLAVAFDNEQRLVKNYLTRSKGKATIDIISNVVAFVLPEDNSLSHREDFKISHWKTAEPKDMHKLLKLPSVNCCAQANQLRWDYIHGRLQGILKAGLNDKVATLVLQDEDANTIQCPKCKAVYPRLTRNCKTVGCDVGNIRHALSSSRSVIHEVHRSARSSQREGVLLMRPNIVEVSGTPTIGHVATERADVVEKSACTGTARPVHVHLLEPCFVNPASLEAVQVLLRHVGQHAGVKQYGGTERDWLAVTCDGVPYYLVRKAIEEAQRVAVKEQLVRDGWVDTSKLLVKDLKDVLRRAGLPVTGTKAQLLDRVHIGINEEIEQRALQRDVQCDGEFDWVVPCMGGLHQEFMICRSFLDVNWDVAHTTALPCRKAITGTSSCCI